MKMPVQERAVDIFLRTSGRFDVDRTVLARPSGDPSVRPRPVYVAKTDAGRSIDWLCLVENAGECIAECGLDAGCYAECAPEAVDCL